AAYWDQVVIMNDYQKRRFAQKIITSLFNTVTDKKIAMLGWAFKKDTNDTRESAAIYVTDHLLNDLALVHVYDPRVTAGSMYNDLNFLSSRSPEENERMLTVHNNPYDACKDAHAIAVVTEWDEFKTLDWKRIFSSMKKPAFLFDGRNILDHDALRKIGFKVYAIGKGERM
nr:UDP binding domain-containing protein [Tenuifilaceae bacterium]